MALDILGLVLAWTRTGGSLLSLQLHFGLSMTNLAMYLCFGCKIIIEVRKNNPLASIKIPSPTKVKAYKHLVMEKYPALTNVWASVDSMKTPIQQASTTKQQGYYFNSWKHSPLCDICLLLLSQWHHPQCVHEHAWFHI